MSRTTIRLTIDVTYEPNNTHTDDLKDLLLDLPTRAMREGLFTGHTDAEVIISVPSVEAVQ